MNTRLSKWVLKIQLITIVALMFAVTLFAYDEERNTGMNASKNKMRTAMQQLENKEPSAEIRAYGDTTYQTLSKVNAHLTKEYFNKTTMTDYTLNKTLLMLSQLAITSAFSIGTAAQPAQTDIIKETATGLSTSSNSYYQELGAKFEKMATSMQEGNAVEAKATAEEIKDYAIQNAPEISSDYKPSQEENSLLAGLASVLSNTFARILPLLTNFAISALGKILGIATSALTGPIGIVCTTLLQETLGAVFTGITNGGQVNWTPVGNAAVNQTVGLVDKGSQQVVSGAEQSSSAIIEQITPAINWDELRTKNEVSGSGNAIDGVTK